jgi:hypothetical protein
MKLIFYSLLLLMGMGWFQGCASTKKPSTPDEARAYFETLRSEFNAGKVRVLNDTMHLSTAEADKFWPIYREYEKDLAAVGDRKVALLTEFVGRHFRGTLNDQNSEALTVQWLQNSQDRLDLWKQYQQRISTDVSPVRAAQFVQVENQMAIFLDESIASDVPLIGTPVKRKP